MVHIKKRALWLVATVLSMFDKGVRDMRWFLPTLNP